MDLKKLLEGKGNLKEELMRFWLIKDFWTKHRVKRGQSNYERLEEKVYSMNEYEIIEYFESNNLFYCQILPSFNDYGVDFECYILNKKGRKHSDIIECFKTRKEATIHCAQKLIELS